MVFALPSVQREFVLGGEQASNERGSGIDRCKAKTESGLRRLMTELVTTTGYDQLDMLKDIVELHCDGKVDCDITFGYGGFYEYGKIKLPEYRFDLDPKEDGVVQADSRNIPLPDNSVESVIFDPPFVVGPSSSPGIMRDRFGCYKNVKELWQFYYDTVRETRRILKKNGIMIFKCQDTVSSGKNWFSHVAVMNMAYELEMYPKDLFVLLAKHRLISPNMHNQQHARKYHSYFWVIKNRSSRVDYESYLEGHERV